MARDPFVFLSALLSPGAPGWEAGIWGNRRGSAPSPEPPGAEGAERARGRVYAGTGGEEDSDVPSLPAAGTRTQCQRFAQVHRALPVGGAEGDRHPSLFATPPPHPASQRLSYPVSGLIFYAGKCKGLQ